MTRPPRRTSWESSSSSRSSTQDHGARRRRLARAAQDGADAGHHLLEAERLGDVVVAADGQALDLVVDRVPRREEDDGQLPAGVAQPPGDREAVHVGEHDVEDDEVGVVRSDALVRAVRAVAGDRHLEPGEAQGGGEQLADVGLVLDDEQLGLGDGVRVMIP